MKAWRACAIEYHRLGFDDKFIVLLQEFLKSYDEYKEVRDIYKRQSDAPEHMSAIYNTLAAKSLEELHDMREKIIGAPTVQEQKEIEKIAKHILDNFRDADEHQRINEYNWILKGFFEIRQGNVKRAEEHFKIVYDRTNKLPSSKKYAFAALVGLGIIFYSKGNYQTAFEQFSKAMQSHPACSSTIRVAIASCLYKLEQYDRANHALTYAIAEDPAQPQALVMLSLLEQVYAQKDKIKRIEHRNNAYEYSILASAIDPACSNALNQVANHLFYTWQVLSCDNCDLRSESSIQLSLHHAVHVGDSIRINRSTDLVYMITAVNAIDDEHVEVTLNASIPAGIMQITELETMEYSKVTKLAKDALANSNVAGTRSDSYYILGRVCYAQRNVTSAFQYYRKSIDENPDMMVAWFGMAEIYLSQGDRSSALESFERVLSKNHDDKDTQAYVYLLRGLQKKEMTRIDKIREVATGFKYEADLWLVQGQLRQKDPSEFATALKCYVNALDCIEAKQLTASSVILSNVSVLHHSLGHIDQALEFCKKALTAVEAEIVASSDVRDIPVNPVFRSSDLVDVFYTWSSAIATQQEELGTFTFDDASDSIDAYSIGDDVLINDMIYAITSIDTINRVITASSPIAMLTPTHAACVMRRKVLGHNFCDSYITLCYNYARILEDTGAVNAASEVYIQLLKLHPCFIECYLRLSKIAKDMGNFGDASLWLSRSLEVDEGEPDATICLGDLFCNVKNYQDGQKCYEKILEKNRHDARACISLGNLYYSNLDRSNKEQYDKQKNYSFKYFHNVLDADQYTNIYAGIGLGILSVEDHDYTQARELFSKAREANVELNEDVCTNLGHVHVYNDRLVDAEHLYQATIKTVCRTAKHMDELVKLCEYTALAQYKNKRFDDSLHMLFRAVHQDPTNLRCWYNIAITREAKASATMLKQHKSVADIQNATIELGLAFKLFTLFGAASPQQYSGKTYAYDQSVAKEHVKRCKENLSIYDEHLNAALVDEKRKRDERNRQESEHQARLKAKQEEKHRVLMLEESARMERQAIAMEKERKLEEMREKWAENVATEKSKGKGGKKGQTSSSSATQSMKDLDDMLTAMDASDADANADVSANKKSTDEANDLFGSDDDDDDVDDSPIDAVIDTTSSASASATATDGHRLKRSRDDDDDDEGIFGRDDDDATSSNAVKVSRVADD